MLWLFGKCLKPSFCGHWMYLDQHPFAQSSALFVWINCVIVIIVLWWMDTDYFLAGGCSSDSDKWLSIAGILLFWSEWGSVCHCSVCINSCVCCICTLPYFTGHYLYTVAKFNPIKDSYHRELSSQIPIPENHGVGNALQLKAFTSTFPRFF